MKSGNALVVLVVLAGLILAGLLYTHEASAPTTTPVATSSVSFNIGKATATVSSLGGGKVELVPLATSSPSYETLMNQAFSQKLKGDYQAAAEIWERVAVAWPGDFTVFNNLGNLYGYYLRDYKKAEADFIRAIKNGPTQIYIYRSTYEFYRFILKDDVKAKAILRQGIAANPGSSADLRYLLDHYNQ